jgi:hypothetical protein
MGYEKKVLKRKKEEKNVETRRSIKKEKKFEKHSHALK